MQESLAQKPVALEQPSLVKSRSNALRIGLPKELDSQENRVALSPEAVEILCRNGMEVWVGKNAGAKANFPDAEYLLAGASIKESHEEVFGADIIFKINALNPREMELIKNGSILVSSLPILEKQEEFLKLLLRKKISFLAFEFLEDAAGDRRVVRAMSEIAGSAVLLIATEYLSSINAGKGIVLGGITGVPPTQVLILGAGTVAEYAARSAMGLGASVKIFDAQLHRLQRIQYILGHSTYTGLLDQKNLYQAFKEADVVIGALRSEDLQKGYKIPENWIEEMKRNSVIIDVSIDQGGCFETSKLTSHYSPVFKTHGVIHYAVPNIASRFAHTASLAISNILLPLAIEMAQEGGFEGALATNPHLLKGLVSHLGAITQAGLAQKYHLKFKDLNLFQSGVN
jgi:alanine dehydrogenase